MNSSTTQQDNTLLDIPLTKPGQDLKSETYKETPPMSDFIYPTKKPTTSESQPSSCWRTLLKEDGTFNYNSAISCLISFLWLPLQLGFLTSLMVFKEAKEADITAKLLASQTEAPELYGLWPLHYLTSILLVLQINTSWSCFLSSNPTLSTTYKVIKGFIVMTVVIFFVQGTSMAISRLCHFGTDYILKHYDCGGLSVFITWAFMLTVYMSVGHWGVHFASKQAKDLILITYIFLAALMFVDVVYLIYYYQQFGVGECHANI
ncbi:hypothetical protein NEHOM01_1956 [Nematocida homosporus]|uniref:uncharacterized protein n=1 Tax=Nematocida homosporus TaxID=1912981 RepID=UPI00221F4CAF|nr:uncharacterized protein NEHOM01_1956 [Nematocida homosporus]KAI5187130.1 hypothetical protein NEHOM01_1956 [Nematocida homosporus]